MRHYLFFSLQPLDLADLELCDVDLRSAPCLSESISVVLRAISRVSLAFVEVRKNFVGVCSVGYHQAEPDVDFSRADRIAKVLGWNHGDVDPSNLFSRKF